MAKKTHYTNAYYVGVEEGFLFENEAGDMLLFHHCAEAVLLAFDLMSTREINNLFTITYVSNEDDEHEEIELEIVHLELNSGSLTA